MKLSLRQHMHQIFCFQKYSTVQWPNARSLSRRLFPKVIVLVYSEPPIHANSQTQFYFSHLIDYPSIVTHGQPMKGGFGVTAGRRCRSESGCRWVWETGLPKSWEQREGVRGSTRSQKIWWYRIRAWLYSPCFESSLSCVFHLPWMAVVFLVWSKYASWVVASFTCSGKD